MLKVMRRERLVPGIPRSVLPDTLAGLLFFAKAHDLQDFLHEGIMAYSNGTLYVRQRGEFVKTGPNDMLVFLTPTQPVALSSADTRAEYEVIDDAMLPYTLKAQRRVFWAIPTAGKTYHELASLVGFEKIRRPADGEGFAVIDTSDGDLRIYRDEVLIERGPDRFAVLCPYYFELAYDVLASAQQLQLELPPALTRRRSNG